jgi:hypothetical protein
MVISPIVGLYRGLNTMNNNSWAAVSRALEIIEGLMEDGDALSMMAAQGLANLTIKAVNEEGFYLTEEEEVFLSDVLAGGGQF